MRLQDSSEMAPGTENMVEPSTPTKNHPRSVVFDDLSPPPAPKKHRHRATTTTIATFCCENTTNFMAKQEIFLDFATAAAKGISAVELWEYIEAHSVDHLIELVPSLELPYPRIETRYFVSLKTTTEYREVGRERFEYFRESKKAKSFTRSWYHCEEHRHSYRLSKFEFTEIEGFGLKKAELLPQQFSREKRMIMVRKISQGRKEDIEETARKLREFKKEDIDEVSKQLNIERKEELLEVARRLRSSMVDRSGDEDLHLARVSMYYSESRLF